MNIKYLYSRVLKKMRGSAIANSNIHKTSKVEPGSVVIDTTFERHTFCGYDCLFNNCHVGAFTSIASNVKVGGARHPMEYVSMSPVFLSHRDSVKKKLAKHDYKYVPRTIIGNDVWIGEGCYIKSGVTVGDGAVIGMGSIVTKDVPAYSIYCGNPGRVVKMRFEQGIIDAFLEVKWWDLSDEQLEKLGDLITKPEQFLEKLKSL